MYSAYERERLVLDTGIVYEWRHRQTISCIVMVHGLGGSASETWGDLPNLLMGTHFCRDKDVYIYDYKTSAVKPGGKTIPIIIEEFATFLETLVEKYQSIYFISHSLGSVVTLGTLSALNDIDDIWSRKVRGHVLLAPALWGSRLGWISPSKTARELKTGSDVLKIIRTTWSKSPMMLTCKSFVLFGSGDSIITKEKSDLSKLGIVLKNVAATHVSIPKTCSISEITYRAIMDCLYLSAGSSPYDSRNYILSTLQDSIPDDWEYDDQLGEWIYIPDFRLKITKFDQRGEPREFSEPWAEQFPDPDAEMHNFAVIYDGHRIDDFPMIYCDGFRYLLPLPKSRTDLVISRSQYRIAKIMDRGGSYDLDRGLARARINVDLSS